ncbi:hypothetical protein G7046_g1900 [Stylonectria norvegica]|nr:hypothetical protein G7046_g1900 [Stylonectria norvegica]
MTAPGSLNLNSEGILRLLQTPSSSNHSFSWDTPIPSLEMHGALPSVDSLFSGQPDIGLSVSGHSCEPVAQDAAFETPVEPSDHLSQATSDSFPNSAAYSGSQAEFDMQTALWEFSQTYAAAQDSALSSHPHHSKRTDGSTRRRLEAWPDYRSTSPSLFDSDYSMMASSNNHLISESLLRIYHDVLENNLACWLSEDTCPYKMQRRPSGLVPISSGPEATELISGDSLVMPEWGVAWSNRMYRRVIQLDRVAQATRLIRLTRAENQAASRALDLVIMAFATQWAQGSRRREKYPSVPGGALDSPFQDDMADELAEEFEQSLQLAVWEQAKKALQDVSDLECYRVVYAELVFGLTQKPWASNDHGSRKSAVRTGSGSEKRGGMKSSTLPQIMEIISQEGPPVYMERATRKMHSLRFRFEANESGFMESTKCHGKKQDADAGRRFTSENRGTIGLLYWLAVMFDTVSSSMCERPVALADEDCQHDAALDETLQDKMATTQNALVSQRWKLDMFAQDNPEEPSTSLRWPCTYDKATEGVTRSAPVKVLMFRHVSYLQNALRKRQRGQPIEDIIQTIVLIYRYWNMTSGSFFRDLIKNYDTVPPRIKSWFVCIAIPWHLAALMLADLIDFVDEHDLGLQEASQTRLSAKMAARIRKASATELSDLARVTTPYGSDGCGDAPAMQLPDFHFAVNEGPLLTEPWTVILIRAFTKASIFHLAVADDLRQHEWAMFGHDSEDFQESLRRSENCIKALWCLGRKSEMARNITEVLSEALHDQQT